MVQVTQLHQVHVEKRQIFSSITNKSAYAAMPTVWYEYIFSQKTISVQACKEINSLTHELTPRVQEQLDVLLQLCFPYVFTSCKNPCIFFSVYIYPGGAYLPLLFHKNYYVQSNTTLFYTFVLHITRTIRIYYVWCVIKNILHFCFAANKHRSPSLIKCNFQALVLSSS